MSRDKNTDWIGRSVIAIGAERSEGFWKMNEFIWIFWAIIVLYMHERSGMRPAEKFSWRALWWHIVFVAVVIGVAYAAMQVMFYYAKLPDKTAVAPWKPPPPHFRNPPPPPPVKPLPWRVEK
jgi:hypothetical protein